MSLSMKKFYAMKTAGYEFGDWKPGDSVGDEEELVVDENSAIKRALALHINRMTTKKNGELESVRQQIEQAELDAIAADFEEEERKKRLAAMGSGSWA